MAGLKICTRWRAISARRNLRINSSLLPENIGPTTTSIQPMLPLTMSTSAPLAVLAELTNRFFQLPGGTSLGMRRSFFPVHSLVVKGGKGGDQRDTEGLLAV